MQKYVTRVQQDAMLTPQRSGLMEKDEWKNLGLANLAVDDTSQGKT
jgi:hypothetical protein